MTKKLGAVMALVTVAIFILIGELQEGTYAIAIALMALVVAFAVLLGNFARISGEEE